MIPTSATSSSPPIATIGNQMNNSPNIPGNANASNGNGGVGVGVGVGVGAGGTGQVNTSAFLGVASLILEGRALAEDEYAPQTTRKELKQLINANNAAECGRQSPKPSTSRAAFGDNYSGNSGTSTTMTSSFSIDLANYMGRKSSNSPDTTTGSFLRDHYSSSSESAASSVESNHSRWSQKLSQLRQESPTAQHQMLTARQKIAVECVRGSEAEYVALAINTEHNVGGGVGINEERRAGGTGAGGDFEILRRMSINQMNFYNSPNTMIGGGGGGGSSGGSTENFMCSLQSLASNTCLRAGNPLLVSNTSPPRYLNNRHLATSTTTRFSTPTSQQHLDFSPNCSSSSSASSSSTNNWYTANSPPLMANNSSSSNNKEYLLRKSSTATTITQRMPIPITTAQAGNSKSSMNSSMNSQNLHSNIFSRNTFTNSNAAATCASTPSTPPTNGSRNQTYPKQGPHCDQFLRKMGLAKGDALDAEEHHCDMSYVNITCTRWRAYCIKMENILARGEPICIEVYLGPVGHKILLEQWIITQKEKQPPPTMTLPSLCSAIRSQLYFSQISAWCDLIKKSDKTIYETGRVIYTTPPTTSAAGDLATTIINATACATTTATTMQQIPVPNPATLLTTTSTQQQQTNTNSGGAGGGSGLGISVGGCTKKAPRLNIFYRIKKYDSTACFNSKPNVHNFPNVNISENCCVSVCLKSLPRITGGIPKVGNTTTTQAQISPTIGLTSVTASDNSEELNKTKKPKSETKAVPKTTTNANNKPTTTILTMNCDNNLKELQQQKFITATTSSCCSLPSTFIQNGKNSKITEDQRKLDQPQDIDFDCDDEQQIDLNAGGDSTNISCSSSLLGGNDCDSSNSSFSTNNCGNLSHREKQLLKYRKRMMKRDKKQQLRKTNENTINQIQNENKMEQGDDEEDDDENDVDDNNVHHNEGSNNVINGESSKELNKFSINTKLENGQRQQKLQQQEQLPNNHTSSNSNSSNSIPSSSMLTQLNQNSPQPQQHVKMISTGTQTITNSCTSCGNEKSMICLKCNAFKGISTTNYEEIMEAETLSTSSSSSSSSANSLSSSDIIQTPRNKAELLLQAIQRTPKSNKKHKHKSKDSKQMAAIKPQQQPTTVTTPLIIPNSTSNLNRKSSSHSPQMNGGSSNTNNSTNNSLNNRNSNQNSNNIMMVGCQVCKRQKTQHHFNQPTSSAIEELSSEDNNSLSNNISSSNGIDNTNTTLIISTNHTATDDGGCGIGDGEDDSDNEKDGGRILEDLDCVDNVSIVIDDVEQHGNGVISERNSTSCDDFNEHEIMEEEYFESSTKLTPHIDRCSLNNKNYYGQINKSNIPPLTESIQYQQRSCSTPPLEEQKANANNIHNANAMMAQFKTPTPSEQHQNVLKNKAQQQQQPHKQTPKPNLLHIACNFNKNNDKQQQQHDQQISKLNHLNAMDNNTPTSHNPLLLRRSLPKVNLTPIFCNPNSMMVVSSLPIPIGNGSCNGSATNGLTCKSAEINITQASPTFSFESPSSPAPSITVQKSNSAPTLPNSPSLSPRFVKASAIYKRRSRHLSDRSDRSSLGSDEQFSDEDIDSGMYSPFATSPVKLRTRLAAVFGRKPLLGNLEECLLQRRLVPKIEVMGFKLLLGASGGFCPTQLTIPAAAYFYELKGETLSTPYLCEIRLPRKGYTVPRCGTVQATLLNPMGTVVRMFVIPYDMRDMPTLHQTFIRQRILADTGVQSQQDDNIDVSKQNDVHDGNVGDEKNVDNVTKSEDLGKPQQHQRSFSEQQQLRSPQCNNENNLGHFISAENMKSLRYSIHLRFQTSRSGRLMLHTDIRLLISRRTDCDTAAAHAKGVLEAPNELITNTVMPTNPKYSARQDQTSSKI